LPAGVQSDILLIKTNEEGNSLNFHVRGEVFVEELEDCSSMDGIPLKEWLIEAKGSSTSYTQTDENGQYDLLLDTGTYEVRVIPISPYWQSCVTEKMVIATDFGDSIVNFGVRPEQRCPWMSIDLSTPFLQPCDTATYTISYENQGTNNADAAFIELTFPPELAVVSSDVSWQQLGPLYTFSTEDIIAPFEKHTFQVDALLNCEVLPQATHSVKAHIFPDSLCLLPNENWDGSSLKVVANYQADSIALVIKNIGEKMTTSSSFVVIEDLVILRQGNILLDQNDSLLILLPINDRTYRLEVEQARFHPGTSRPAISIEAFTIDETAVFSTGFVTQFYEDDGDDFISIDAKENTELPANNRLIAAPKGIGANRLIDPKEDIEYQIIFPIYKLDTDSLMRLVIRDSLSEYLDLATFQAGTSSHAYNVQITETGVLKFIFENIPVPLQDTTYGFVKFKIGQKESNQAGLLIENQVRFYRDYDLPATFYIYQHNTGKIVKEENLQSTYCEGMDYEEVPLKDTISNLSFDIINTYEVTELPNIIMEKNTVVNRNGQQILRDTFVAHNGCDSIVIYNSLTDIEEVILAQEAVLVHPNPVQNYLTISCSNQEDFLTSLQLYSSNGQVIKTPILPDFSKNFRLDLQVVPNGLYSLLITTNESIIYAKVLVLH